MIRIRPASRQRARGRADAYDRGMVKITLPDGSVKEFQGPVTALEVAESIGSRLAKAAVGAKVDGALSDLSTRIDARRGGRDRDREDARW